jgi:mannose-6-phosphate isomerase
LYKFIDASQKLSVQVHPSDEQARRMGVGTRGKTECWYVVDAAPGAIIVVGFKEPSTREKIAQAVASGTLDTLLNCISVAPGDVLFVPAGTVHAICENTLIYEVQQTSDVTYRLFDWNRLEADGKPRALHVAESLDVLDYNAHDKHRLPPVKIEDFIHGEHLVRVVCRYFALEEYRVRHAAEFKLPVRTSFQAVTILSGSVTVSINKNEIQLHRGESALLPASDTSVLCRADAGAHLLVSWVPDIESDIIQPLREKGIADQVIALLGGCSLTNDIMPLL